MKYRFDLFELDTATRVLRRGGVAVSMKPRPLELLAYLITHRNRVVPKDEIVAEVWRGRSISDAAISTAVRDIRIALEGTASDRALKTHYGVGLEFAAAVTVLRPDEHLDRPGENRKGYPSVLALLPFPPSARDVELDNLADGFVEDANLLLSKFRDVRVLSRQSTYTLRNSPLTIKEIGTRFGADYVLEGSLRPIGDQLRININLVDADRETSVWGERIDVKRADLMAGDNATCEFVVAAIVTTINDYELERAEGKSVDELNPWECYLRGRKLMQTFLPKLQRDAIDLFQRAIQLDPGLSDPHGTLAYALLIAEDSLDEPSADQDGRQNETRLQSLEAARHAISLDENNTFAWISLSRVFLALGEIDSCIAAAERALALNPHSGWVHNLLGMALIQVNAPDAAIRAFDRALATSPRDNYRWLSLGGRACALVLQKRFDEAIEWSRRAQREPLATYVTYLGEICALGHLGRANEASAVIDRAHDYDIDLSLALVQHEWPLNDDFARDMIIRGLENAGLE